MKRIEALDFLLRDSRLIDELRIERLPSGIVREADFRGTSRRAA
jgi:hypothetical protein